MMKSKPWARVQQSVRRRDGGKGRGGNQSGGLGMVEGETRREGKTADGTIGLRDGDEGQGWVREGGRGGE